MFNASMVRSRHRRGMATVALGALIVGLAGAAAMAARATSAPALPPTTPDRLIASTLRALADPSPVSGSIATHVDLGLPSLPDEGPQAAGGLAEVVSSIGGDHRVRLWSSRDGIRVAELLPFSELSFVASRTDAWAWDSSAFTAYHLGPYPRVQGGAGESANGTGATPGPVGLLDPLEMARRTLQALSPTTRVSVGGTARVAGRAAYVLVVEPRTSATLVGRIEVSIDAERHLPLRVAVFARGAGAPAISAGFTAVGFDPIPPRTFAFTPPPGAKVRSANAALRGATHSVPIAPPAREAGGSLDEYYRTFGTGWAAVFAVRAPPIRPGARGGGLDLGSLLPYSGPLLSVRMIDRGDHHWLVFGMVPPTRLVGAAANLP